MILTLRLTVGDLVISRTGESGWTDPEYDKALERAEATGKQPNRQDPGGVKGAASNALKRAAAAFGVGEYLYEIDPRICWIDLDDRGYPPRDAGDRIYSQLPPQFKAGGAARQRQREHRRDQAATGARSLDGEPSESSVLHGRERCPDHTYHRGGP